MTAQTPATSQSKKYKRNLKPAPSKDVIKPVFHSMEKKNQIMNEMP